MDWIRKNKFLAGFLAIMIVGVGALGYLVYAQMDVYDQTSQDYQAATTELDRLQGLKPFPYQKSKVNLTALRGETAERVTNLQKRLSDYEPPAENPNFKPIEFQDKLRRVVEETTQAAGAANMKLPADFYMGFEQYRSTPPEAPAAPLLSRQLDVIQDLLKILIARRVDELKSIKRAPLPQEAAGSAAPTPKPGPGGKPAPAAPVDAVSRQTVDVAFSGQSSAFREALDDLVISKRLFLVRAVAVKNQKPKGPPRDSTAASSATPPPAATGTSPAPADAASDKPALEYVVGLEKIDADMRVEIVKVAPPVVASTPPAR